MYAKNIADCSRLDVRVGTGWFGSGGEGAAVDEGSGWLPGPDSRAGSGGVSGKPAKIVETTPLPRPAP